MSVIQKIRDKYARWAVIAIAVSLLGFILMDAFNGRTGLFNGSDNSTLGKIAGVTVDRAKFDKEMQIFASVYQVPEEQRPMLMEQLWTSEVDAAVIEKQADELGLTVTDKELREVLYGSNPPKFLTNVFSDQSGKFDAVVAQQQVNNILKKGAPGQENYDYINLNIEFLKKQLVVAKYRNLMMGSIYFPKWLVEQKNIDNSLVGTVSYVNVPYASIADSTIKISDNEIMDFAKEHRDEFEQKKETRSIQYVLFSQAPSATDSAAAKTEVENLKSQFAAATDPGVFLTQHNSVIQYDSTYHGKSTIQVPAKDSIFNTPIGAVYGPYLDVNNWVLAKVIDVKNLPDSVKCRHILLGTVNPQTGEPLMSDSVAKAKADSIAAAIKNGASFDLLDSLYSTDQAAKSEKGVMTFASSQIQGPNFAKEFGDFILWNGKPGDKKVIKTQFGWHYIEIMDHIKVEPHYKVAYLAKTIEPSQETDNQIHNLANMFAGDSRDQKSFDANFDKMLRPKGYQKQVAENIDPMETRLNGVNGSARSFIKKVFETDKGDVIDPESVPGYYVVAIVTNVNEPGLPGVAALRPMIEPVLRNKKKAEIIVKNIGQVTTLEDVASKTKQQIQMADSVRLGGGSPQLGFEPKVFGALFNPANKGKVLNQPIKGSGGVFVIRVDNTGTVPVETANPEEQRKQMEMQAKQQIYQQLQYQQDPILDPLKKSASIKDYRAKFY